MAAKTYLDIVNEVIAESKVSLDPLEAADWANPPRTRMYNDIKRFVNRAYKDLMKKRPEWQFRNERAVTTIWPRLHVAGLVYTPAPGDVLQGASSGVRFEVISVHNFEDVELSVDVERTLSIDFDPDSDGNNIILNESLDRISPAPLSDVGYIKGRGRYDFEDMIPSLEQLSAKSVSIQPAVAFTPNPSAHDLVPAYALNFVPWDVYGNYFDGFSANLARPYYIGQASDGKYDFYPRPDGPYDIAFEYTQKIIELVNPTDLPGQLPERYEDLIMWKALMDYADFDERPKTYARGKKHVDEYMMWLERDKLQEFSLDLYRFDG